MRPSRRFRPSAGLVLAALLAGCASDPGGDLPAGTLWAGDATAARQLLRGIEALTGSPAANAAQQLAARLAGCDRFLAFCRAGEPCSLAAQVDCRPAGDLQRRANAVRGDAAWILSHREGARRFTAWGTPIAEGGFAIRVLLAEPEEPPQAWQALLPASRAPAAPVLATRGALIRLRLRSDRGAAPLAGLAQGNRAAEMYGLRAEAFARMALEGTTELMLYEPASGEPVPPLALAIHVRLRDAAVQAIESWLAHLRKQWPVSRSPWSIGGHDGACLSDLNVLPALAPCYVATDRALVLGWNQRSVALALGAPPPSADGGAAASELAVDLERLPQADQMLRASYSEGTGPVLRAYPWSGLSVVGSRRRGGYELDVRLAPPRKGGGAPARPPAGLAP